MQTMFSMMDVTEQDIKHILGIFSVNSHEIACTNSSKQGIYKTASMIEHSCFSNCYKHFDDDDIIYIRTSTLIKKGERISINYSDPIWGTTTRQMHLWETKGFYCSCIRCKDPTELGSYYSAINCTNCKDGYMLPKNPLDSKSEWICEKCGAKLVSEIVMSILKAIGEEIITLKNNVEASFNFLRKHYQNLHPNHYFLTEVKLVLCQIIGKSKTSEKELLKKQEFCLDLLNIVDKISPGKF